MKWTSTEKRQLLIFALIAFALPYLLGILMGISYFSGNDTSPFPNAQMYYPAAGVMLAMLLTRKHDPLLPRKFYTCFLVLTLALIAVCVLSVAMPTLPWAIWIQFVMIAGTLICWGFYFLDKKNCRTAYGLRLTKTGGSNPAIMVILFVVLYFARILLAGGLAYLFDPASVSGESEINTTLFVINLVALPINFFLVFTAFFGEEYGWRGFLQPLLQKRFGPRKGIIILGLLWGIWHLPINCFFYSPQTWYLSILNQLFLCVCYSVFFGFAYQKTKTIWVPVIIHFINNNAITLFASADSIQNQVLTLSSILLGFVSLGILYLPFFASNVFRSNSESQPAAFPFFEENE